jgi:2-methylcitrate dehydratase PrpD
MSESVTETLAKFSSELQFDDLPAEVAHEIKRLLLDTLGCGFGGLELDKGRMALALARQNGGRPEATILGTTDKFPAAMTAFVNGELMNGLDWCALQPPAHVAPYVIPSVLALAEVNHTSGKELIAALAVAHELTCRIAHSLGNLRSPVGGLPARSFGMGCNEFGATGGAARILGLDAERMRHALGLAGYFAPVASHNKYTYTVHPGLAKYGPSGWTAQAGVVTALLVKMGYRGDDTVLDGEYGFWAMNGSPSCDWEKLTDALGIDWAFRTIGYKYWPCCGMFQSPLDAFTKIINEHDVAAREITKVLVRNEAMNSLPRYMNIDVRDHVEAAASLPYNIAVAAHRVPLGPKWQSRDTMESPDIRELMTRVEQEVYPRCEEMRHQDLVVEGKRYLSHRPAQVEVHARGRMFVHTVDYAQWLSNDVPEFRASDEGLAQKFQANASGVLSRQQVDSVVDCVMHLEDLSDSAKLATMLASGS